MHHEPTRQAHQAQAASEASPRGVPERLRLASRYTYSATGKLQAAWIDLLSRYHWDLFGTLTFRNDTHPEAVLKLFRLFLSMINRKLYGPRWYKHNKGVSYCVAMERQLRGVLHLHCLLADPELVNLLKGSWFKQANGHWGNRLFEMWNELAGFARIEPIECVELVQNYVSKYVVKGGEIDLGGPLAQRRLEQVPAGSIATVRATGGPQTGKDSDSVPGLPVCGRVGELPVYCSSTVASHLSSLTGCGATGRGAAFVAQEHSAPLRESITLQCAPAS